MNQIIETEDGIPSELQSDSFLIANRILDLDYCGMVTFFSLRSISRCQTSWHEKQKKKSLAYFLQI